MTLEQTLLKRVDEQACIDFLAEMVRHRSYSETEGERELALFMQRAMREIGLESKLQPVTGKRVNAARAARRERRRQEPAVQRAPGHQPGHRRLDRRPPGAPWWTAAASTESASPT